MTILAFPSLTIKPLEKQWLNIAAQFLYDNWHQTYDIHLPNELIQQRTLVYFTKNLEKRFSNCLIAVLNGQLVGLIISSSNCIDDIWVRKKYQRRHIGKKLIAQLQIRLQSRGFKSVQVGCENFNTKAIAFFQALNWNSFGSEPLSLSPGHHYEALVFGKKL